MRDMLIDDRHALVVDGDDEGVAKLTERNHRPDVGRVRSVRFAGSDFRRDCVRACRSALTAGRPIAARPRIRHPAVRIHASAEHAWNRPQRRRLLAQSPAAAATAARRPARARPSAPRRTTSCTSDCSRKRTSAFVGWTFTSTALRRHLEEQMDFRAAFLDRRHAVGVDDRVRDRPVLDDAAVDEDVLRPARRAPAPPARRCSRSAEGRPRPSSPRADRRARRTSDTADRAAIRAGGHWSTVRPPLVSAKPISGYASASCVATRDTCADSAPSDFRNLRRAGRL